MNNYPDYDDFQSESDMSIEGQHETGFDDESYVFDHMDGDAT